MGDSKASAIGVFDSGYGGLTVLKSLVKTLPKYDYLYLGDNARAPYGPRSFETVYQYTLEAVSWLFDQGCNLIILACNTSSAKALRSIQINDLPKMDPKKRVLGVIRPSTEVLGEYSKNKSVGIFGTSGTIKSNSYKIELNKFFPSLKVSQLACPMFVPLVENQENLDQGADYFVEKYLRQLNNLDEDIDTILLACTHYPLLKQKITKRLKPNQKLLTQGDIVAVSLKDYFNRHPEMDEKCSKNGKVSFFTTDAPLGFDQKASQFYGQTVRSSQITL